MPRNDKVLEIPENRSKPLRDRRPCSDCGKEGDVHLSVVTKRWHWDESGKPVRRER